MKKLILVMLFTGCASTAQTAQLEKAVQQQAIVIDAIVNYIGKLQEKGVLPKPEEEKK